MTSHDADAPATTRWSVEAYGAPGDATTCVLVHGIGVSARYFRRLATVLGRDRLTLVPDLPGFGRTPPLDGEPTITALADGLVEEIAGRGVRRAVLLGHSMGAQVVAEAARRHPDVAERVVLLGPVVDPAARSARAQALRLARDTLHEPLDVNAIVFSDYVRAGPRRYAAQLPHMLGFDLDAAVTQVRCPVVVVRGEQDHIAPDAWVARLAGLARDGRALVVPGAAHVVQHVRPGEVAALCREGS
ncbi:alpha/beta fold hydrolase [Cellulomonas fimi]|uniref:Alpha/beta hydrolase fold protein n=1 Tax=Cellulomonas fimi (strain ATCC 484 / DSM 20113 / JCM 1341 / CCUG 24087 / LMG 16345 / NBRC 15513 / NCIMB 8980 / NCTC 7547 / NRS-133) TaxID=590998 RepID=F4H5Y5_CELFA|nr:alpha/beta hydrolase [Cellulomonas fimi]AEE46715.1 alpha/beta hydrolase fold protein [Cellulomonas fimi ATCC 484]NNH07640.1 alpha/beta hydrolase [Cellulomonas fimi]VEH33967.1 Tropinesterase [Cellulomonas fimi]